MSRTARIQMALLLITMGPITARAQTDALTPLAGAMSAQDVSVLKDALSRDNATLITSRGSANFVLWSAFASRGWMSDDPAPGGGGPVGQHLHMYTITDEGRKGIAGFLAAAGKQ